MVWLTLLVVWAAAAIVVAVVWGKLVSWSQDGGAEHPDAAPASELNAPSAPRCSDNARGSSHR